MFAFESLLVIVIVGMACAGTVWKLVKILKGEDGCCGGCGESCPFADLCQSQERKPDDKQLR